MVIGFTALTHYSDFIYQNQSIPSFIIALSASVAILTSLPSTIWWIIYWHFHGFASVLVKYDNIQCFCMFCLYFKTKSAT